MDAVEREWLEMHLLMDYKGLQLSIRKLCNMYGIVHLYDEVLAEALYIACDRSINFNSSLSAFNTWVIEHAKMVVRRMTSPTKHTRYGGEQTSGVHLRYQHMYAELPVEFSDEDDSETGDDRLQVVMSPMVFDTYDFGEPDPSYARILDFVESLTDDELACLELLLKEHKRFPSYRKIGRHLGTHHVAAGTVLRTLREKASVLQT